MIKIAYIAGTAGAGVAAVHTSSYRVKFRKKEFLDLIDIANPKLIYQVNKIFFFAYDGFVMYTFECQAKDFMNQCILRAIEFSNQQWAHRG